MISRSNGYVTLLIGLWRTRQTEDVDSDRELHVKTTLRELAIYIVFIVVLCICKFTIIVV